MAIWSVLEPTTAVICACIPSLRPLASVIGRGFSALPTGTTLLRSTMHSRGTASKRTWGGGSKQSNGDFSQLDEAHDLRPLGHDVSIGQAGTEGIELPPKHGINVKTEVTLVTEDRLYYDNRLF